MSVAPWATVDDLPAERPKVTGGDEEWERLLLLASETLYVLSGRRWSGAGTRTVALRSVGAGPLPGTLGEQAAVGVLWLEVGCSGGAHLDCQRASSVRLPSYPVNAVLSVAVDGAPRVAASYHLEGRRYLVSDAGPWPTCSAALVVEYEYGVEPPAGGKAAAIDLALALGELSEANGDVTKTRLPGLRTSIDRQGVSVGYETSTALLAAGKTGLYLADLWLAAVNPTGRRRRSSSWSPDTHPTVLPR